MNTPNTQDEKTVSKALNIYKIVTVVAAVITVAATSLAFLFTIEGETRFLNDSPLSFLWYAVIAIDAAIAISSVFVFKKRTMVEAQRTRFVSGISALPIIALVISVSLLLIIDKTCIPKYAVILGAILSSIYFICDLIGNRGNLKMSFGCIFIIFCIMIAADLYLDTQVEKNMPVQIVCEFAAIFMAVSTVSEIKSLFPLKNARTAMLSYILCAILCPSAAASATAVLSLSTERFMSNYVFYAPLFFAYGIYSVVRILALRQYEITDENDYDAIQDRINEESWQEEDDGYILPDEEQ